MVQVIKKIDKAEWVNLGRIRPTHSWQSYQSFTEHWGTFRLLAFSFSNTYERFCYLRIRYDFDPGVESLYLNFPPRKMTKALSKGSCSDFRTTRYWVQSL